MTMSMIQNVLSKRETNQFDARYVENYDIVDDSPLNKLWRIYRDVKKMAENGVSNDNNNITLNGQILADDNEQAIDEDGSNIENVLSNSCVSAFPVQSDDASTSQESATRCSLMPMANTVVASTTITPGPSTEIDGTAPTHVNVL